MNIAFDAQPLMGRLTGIGYCEAGLVKALTALYPEQDFTLNYFAARRLAERKSDLQPFLSHNVNAKHAFCPPYVHRLLTSVLPVPYAWFFGKHADITHFFNYIVPPGVSGKTVVTVHDMVYRAFPETVRGRTRRMLDACLEASMRRADRIVTDSEFSRSEITKYYPEFSKKIRVVPCGVDTKRFHPETDAAKIAQVRETYGISECYFLYLGTIEPRKNLERLIDAFAQLETHSQLVLAGAMGWLYDGILESVRSLHLENRVVFTQYVDAADLCALMSGAIAFTFPSLYEGFGMPPLEAMACGAPVLVSDAASLPEVVGDCAVIVDPRSTASIAQGLQRLLTDAPLRASLSARGLERAKSFSWERSAGLLFEVYSGLTSGSKESEYV